MVRKIRKPLGLGILNTAMKADLIRKETENTSFLHCFLQNAQIFNG